MTEKNIVKRKKVEVSEVVECLKGWKEGVRKLTEKAARVFVDFIDQDRNNIELIREKTKCFLARSTLLLLEGVGRGGINPAALDLPKNRRAITKLPRPVQDKVIDGERYPYLTADGTHLKLCVRDCESRQAKQMFADGQIRTLTEQKEWIEAEKTKARIEQAEHNMPYEPTKKGVLFKEAMTFLTWKELRKLALQGP